MQYTQIARAARDRIEQADEAHDRRARVTM